jgi:large subunit ribosomal protein L21
MSYAIISVGGKQYRVREGEKLLVDRVAQEDGKRFTPPVLLVGGDGDTQISPTNVVVTAKVLGQQRGPKIRIGKYKKRTGYKRHTGFRSALTAIQIESIGAAGARATAKAVPTPKAASASEVVPAAPAVEAATESGEAPSGYAEMTIAEIRAVVGSWDATAVAAALAFEQAHGKRKGAIAALESALTTEEH